MLAFLKDDGLIPIKTFLYDTHVRFSLVKTLLTNVDNVQGLAGGEHLGQGFTSFACGGHHVLLTLSALIHFSLTLDRKYLLFDHFPGLFRQLNQVMVFDLTSKSLHIEDNLDSSILDILICMADRWHCGTEYT